MSKQKPEYPPIDIRYKVVDGLFGRRKVATTKEEQREMKRKLLAKNPNLTIIDDLDNLDWIDELEELDAIFDD